MVNSTWPAQRLSQEEFEHIKFLKQMKYKYMERGIELKKTANEAIMGLSRNLCIFFGYHSVLYSKSIGFNELFYFTVLCLFALVAYCFSTCVMINSISKRVERLVEEDKVLRARVDVLATNIRDNIEIVQVATDLGRGPTVVANVRLFPQVLDHGKNISLLASLKTLVREPSAPTGFKFSYAMLIAINFLIGVTYSLGLAAMSYRNMFDGNSAKNNLGNLDFKLLKPT